MNVLARINAGSTNPIVPDPVKEPAPMTPSAAVPSTRARAPLGSPRTYAGLRSSAPPWS